MKTRILWAVLAAAALLGACTPRTGTPPDRDPGAVAESILSAVTFRDELVKAEGDVAENYYSLGDGVEAYGIYISGSGATAEEIAVLKVNRDTSVEDARAVLVKRVEDQKRRYESYVPGEMVKLEDAVIVADGDMAVLVVADDAETAEDAARAALGQE